MTVGELIGLLEGFNENQEVRLMTQEMYPLQAHVQGVYEEQLEGVNAGTFLDAADMPKVWITEGEQIGYGLRVAWVSDRRSL